MRFQKAGHVKRSGENPWLQMSQTHQSHSNSWVGFSLEMVPAICVLSLVLELWSHGKNEMSELSRDDTSVHVSFVIIRLVTRSFTTPREGEVS